MARANGLQPVVQGRSADSPGGVVLAIGIVRGVQQPEALRDPLAQVFPVALEGMIAPHVHFPQVRRRVPVKDPLRDHLANSAGGLQADRIQSGRHETVVEFGRLADVVAHVRRKTLRPAEERREPGRFQRRDTHHGLFEDRLEMLETAGDLVETEVLGNTLHAPRAGVGFEGAHEEPSRVVLVVDARVVVAHHREVHIQPRDRFEQGVVMLAGMQGHVHADRRRQLPGPHAGAQHHAVRVDVAVFRGHAGDAAARGTDVRDRQVLKDARTGVTGAPGERVGNVDRVGVAVGRNVNAPEHVRRMQ